MPSVYYLANGELPVVQAFLNLSQLPREQKREQPQKEDMQEIVSSLLKKEYLSMTPEGRYRLDESLAFILTAAGNAHGVFKMQRSGGKNCVLAFVNDTIVLLQEEDGGVEAMWLPHLPLAIGFVASTLEPFLNEFTGTAEVYDTPDAEQLLADFTDRNYELCWHCSAQCADEALNAACFILSNGAEQIMMTAQNGGVCVTRPSKEDMVNSLTRMFAPLHGSAMRIGGVLDGNV